jgi:hypothetical protein
MMKKLEELADRLHDLPRPKREGDRALRKTARKLADSIVDSARNYRESDCRTRCEEFLNEETDSDDEAVRILRKMVRIVEDIQTDVKEKEEVFADVEVISEPVVDSTEVLDAVVLDSVELSGPVISQHPYESPGPDEANASPGRSKYFWTRDGKKQFGPVLSKHLRAMAKAGQLLPSDLVWKQGAPKWIAAARVKGLFDSLASGETE